MARKRQQINKYKVINDHPVTGEPIDLQWYRGANRYNNGATRFGNKYKLRYLLAYNKEQPYTSQQLGDYSAKQDSNT